MLNRRTLIRTAVATCLVGGLPRLRAEPGGRGARKTGPRYFVTIFLRGGMDGVYTVDPKTKAQVDANVDVPYEQNAIFDAGALQFGPHFAPLAKWAKQIAVVRGVNVSTANHETGAYQVVRMRIGAMPNVPSLGDIIGTTRDGQPLASVTMGKLASFEHSPGAVAAPTGAASEGVTSLDVLDKMSEEELEILARSFARHLKAFPSHPSGAAERTRDHVEQMASFFKALQGKPRFSPVDWGADNGDARRGGEDLQRTLWFLENDLARCVLTKIQFDWDSHYRNAEKQSRANGDFVQLLSRFLDGLHTRKNAHGTLLEQTVVVVGSELGRFPVINGNLGKDHFPEAPFLVFGAGINGGNAFVETGKKMEASKVSLTTGKPDGGGALLQLDDLGATLLHMAGMNPAVYGYAGRRLAFLERA